MTYHTIALLAQLGIGLIVIGLIVRLYNPIPKRGATKASKQQIGAHQDRREAYMLRHDGLPVEIRRVAK